MTYTNFTYKSYLDSSVFPVSCDNILLEIHQFSGFTAALPSNFYILFQLFMFACN